MKDFQFLFLCILLGWLCGTSSGIRDDIKNQTKVVEEAIKVLKETKQ